MNWLTNFVRPRIRALVQKTDVPDRLWQKCPKCGQMIFHRELEANLNVCPHCGHHMRISAAARLAMLFDEGQYHRIELPKTPSDPLKFRDVKRYGDRLKEAQGKTSLSDAIVVAHGRMGGLPVVVAAFEFEFQGGSMGVAGGRPSSPRRGSRRSSRQPSSSFPPRAARACRKASSRSCRCRAP